MEQSVAASKKSQLCPAVTVAPKQGYSAAESQQLQCFVPPPPVSCTMVQGQVQGGTSALEETGWGGGVTIAKAFTVFMLLQSYSKWPP